jgi:hypothetical protein
MRTVGRAALVVSLLSAASFPTGRAIAQDVSDAVAYVALIATPPGAFAPLVTKTMLGDGRHGTDFVFRYGRGDLGVAETNNLALTWTNGSARGSFGFTVGYWSPDCDDCDGNVLAGLGGDVRLLSGAVGAAPSAMVLTVGLSGELGFAKPEDGMIWSTTFGIPVTLVAGSTISGTRIAPFLTPGFGWGRISGDGESESGTRAMLGSGLAIKGRSIGATFGFQKVFIDEGETTFGVNVSFQM